MVLAALPPAVGLLTHILLNMNVKMVSWLPCPVQCLFGIVCDSIEGIAWIRLMVVLTAPSSLYFLTRFVGCHTSTFIPQTELALWGSGG